MTLAMSSRIPGLDVIRACAIAMVITGHYTLTFFAPGQNLESIMEGVANGGVILFFLLSGYLIYKNLLGTDVPSFIIRRLFKIFPAYIVSVFALLVAAVFFEEKDIGFRYMIGNLLMIQDVLGVGLLNGVFWSLLVEIKFYFLMVIIFSIKPERWIGFSPYGLILLNVAHFMFFGRPSALLIWMPVFFVGVELYRCQELEWNYRSLTRLGSLVAAICISLMAFYEYNRYTAPLYVFFGAVFFFVALRLKRSPKIISWLAAISYSAYLYHSSVGYPLWVWLQEILGVESQPYIILSLVLFISLGISHVSSKYIEIPGVYFGRRLEWLLGRKRIELS